MADQPLRFPGSDRVQQLITENNALRGALRDLEGANRDHQVLIGALIWKFSDHGAVPVTLTKYDMQSMPAGPGVFRSHYDPETNSQQFTFEGRRNYNKEEEGK